MRRSPPRNLVLLVSVLVAAHALPARAEDERRGVLTLRFTNSTGLPDLLSGGVTINAIPNADLELGGTVVLPIFASVYLRAGPRWTLHDGRDADARGLTLRLSALAGPRLSTLLTASGGYRSGLGLNAVAALEGTYWIFRHFGFSLQAAAGGTTYVLNRAWSPLLGPLTPDLRLSFGVAF